MSFIIIETSRGVYKRIPAPKNSDAAISSPLPTPNKPAKPQKTVDQVRWELRKIRTSESSRGHSVSFN